LIVRVARYRVKEGREREFEKLLREEAIPMLRRQKGIMVAYIGRAIEPERRYQYVTVSVWRSLDDVKAFAGEAWDQVVVLEREAEMLDGPPELEQSESLES
jgi:heme-degrading monooxygenase HmoA